MVHAILGTDIAYSLCDEAYSLRDARYWMRGTDTAYHASLMVVGLAMSMKTTVFKVLQVRSNALRAIATSARRNAFDFATLFCPQQRNHDQNHRVHSPWGQIKCILLCSAYVLYRKTDLLPLISPRRMHTSTLNFSLRISTERGFCGTTGGDEQRGGF